MLPPPLPNQRIVHKPEAPELEQLEVTPSQRYQETSSNVGVLSRRDQHDVHMYRDGAWNDVWNGNPRTPSRSSRPYGMAEPYAMSGVIGSISNRHALAAHRGLERESGHAVPQPQLTRPAPESRMEYDEPFRRTFPPPVQRRQGPNLAYSSDHYTQAPAAARVYSATQPMEIRLPSRAASRSSFMRQPLIPVASRGNIRGPDSGSLSNVELHHNGYEPANEDFTPGTARHYDRLPPSAVESPFFKPHFNGPTNNQVSLSDQRSSGGQSEQLVSGLRHLQVEPAALQPRLRPSLNALSFIDEPYTSTNQPIYAQQQRPFSTVPQQRETQPFRPAVISRSGFIEDPRVPQRPQKPKSIRLLSAAPSLTQTQPQRGGGGSIVRQVGYAARPSTNSYAPGGGYFPRNGGAVSIGLFSSGGRRSVRR
jgi:hypothetical protein